MQSALSATHPASPGSGLGSRAVVLTVVVLLHVLVGWALLRMVIRPEPAPEKLLEVSWLAQPEAKPEPPRPQPPKRITPPPKAAPVIAAAPTPQAAPAPMEVAPEPPAPAPVVTPAPVQAPAPVAAPAPQPRTLSITELQIKVPARPVMPSLSVKLNEQGKVLIRFLIDTNGKVAQALVHQSSGFDRLDRAALRAVERAEFSPHTEGGRALAAWAIYPIEFKLE